MQAVAVQASAGSSATGLRRGASVSSRTRHTSPIMRRRSLLRGRAPAVTSAALAPAVGCLFDSSVGAAVGAVLGGVIGRGLHSFTFWLTFEFSTRTPYPIKSAQVERKWERV
jgi:hypothetical protein